MIHSTQASQSVTPPFSTTTSSSTLADPDNTFSLEDQNAVLLAEIERVQAEYDAFREKHVECGEELKRLRVENERLMEELQTVSDAVDHEVEEKETGFQSLHDLYMNDAPFLSQSSPSAPTADSTYVPNTAKRDRLSSSATASPPPPKKAKPTTATTTTTPFKHITPFDPSLTGEPFYRALKDSGQIRSYNTHHFYCLCRPEGWANNRGRQEGTSHVGHGKPYARWRWNEHVKKCEGV